MPNDKDLNLTDEDILAMQQGVYGEAAGASDEVKKMVTQSIINRLRSGKTKEFGGTVPEILQKGYYAVKDKNVPYQQAVSGEFPDIESKKKWGVTKKIVENVIGDKDYGEAQFYFTPEEVEKQKDTFDFKKVRPLKLIDKYQTYSY